MSDFPVLARIVRLPDGRWAVENVSGVGDLTRGDIEQIYGVFMLWADVLWRTRHQPADEPEVKS